MAGIGHNSGLDRRSENIIAICEWVGQKRIKDAVSRQRLGQLQGLERLIAIRNATLDNLRQFYVHNPRADVGPGILVLICMMSDNSDGCCSVSVTRMSEFFKRTRRNIGLALARLEENHCIKVERHGRNGKSPLVWPIINPVYVDSRDPVAWVLDAHAPYEKHTRPALSTTQVGALSTTQVDEPALPTTQVVNFPNKNKEEDETCVDYDAPQGCVVYDAGGALSTTHNTTNRTNTSITTVVPRGEGGVGGEGVASPSAQPAKEENQPSAESKVEILEPEPVTGEVIEPGKKSAAKPKSKSKSSRKVKFPGADYFGPDDLAYALRQGLTDRQARMEFQDFRDHHIAKDNKFVEGVGWRLAWQKWCRNAKKWSGGTAKQKSHDEIIDEFCSETF